MAIDTLIPTGSPVALLAPPTDFGGNPYVETGFAIMGGDPDEIVVAAEGGFNGVIASGYGLDGTVLFRDVLQPRQPWVTSQYLNLAAIPTGGVAAVWLRQGYGSSQYNADFNVTSVITGGGSWTPVQNVDIPGSVDSTATAVFPTPTGYHVEWVQVADQYHSDPNDYHTVVPAQDFLANGQAAGPATVLPNWQAYAHIALSGQDFLIQDNLAQLGANPPVALPGEPAHAVTEVTAVSLSGGTAAAVAFADAGTGYVSIYDAAANGFGPRIGLALGGVSDLHLVALPDGDFVVSWYSGSAYAGEVFDSAGDGGGVIPLDGQVAGIDSHGGLYTVGHDAAGNEQLMTYAIDGAGGQTFDSDNNGDVWIGTAGNDIFNIGRGGDWVAGNGGNDTFRFAGIPWAGGHITDFNAGDVLDLTGLMATTSDTGTDGFADGYLRITDDGAGNAQVWADYHIPGNDGWWLVETLDGVAPASLRHLGDLASIGLSSGPTNVSTAAGDYTAPAAVKTITLTGSQQVIDASATNGVAITSNDTGNALIGGPGDDVFHLGRGGDWAAGGGGADTFIYSGTPWAGGGITDFSGADGDIMDVTGLLAASRFTGSDPFTEGYLKFTTDAVGNAQLWSDLNQPGNDGWWLVATLDGVSTSSLHYAAGLIT